MKLTINTNCCVPSDQMARNRALSPDLPSPHGTGRLAVVGGGPSIVPHMSELRTWPGDIWAINGAWRWCKDCDVDAFLYSLDPDPILADYAYGVSKAVLAEHCDPAAFKAFKGDVFKATGEMPGPTSAIGASALALRAGYSGVTYFGCEGSFTDRTHAYQEQDPPDLIRVKCGGELFLTKLELILQTEQLSNLIRAFPKLYSERSGGFLRALVEHGDYDVTHVSRKMQFA